MNRKVNTSTRFAAIVAALTLGFAFTNVATRFDRITPSAYATNFTSHRKNEISPAFVSRTQSSTLNGIGKNDVDVLLAISPASETKRVLVLFPMARDAQEIPITIEDGEMIYQDDIVIDPSQVVSNKAGESDRKVDLVLNVRRALKQQGATSRAFSAGAATWLINWGRWPDGIIPYKINDDMPQDKRDLIAQAIDNINSKTNLCFRKKESGDDDYVEYVPVENVSYHGRSAIGHIGGRQKIKLNIANASLKTAVHESMHAAGFIHEHCRSDRDSFIRINRENILPGKEDNFGKDPFSENYTTYDFNSVMHYSQTNFGITLPDGTKAITMEPLNPVNTINPLNTLSPLDVVGVNTAYPNAATCHEKTKRLRIVRIRTDGTLGPGNLVDEVVSSGWADAEPIQINGATTHMMFLNTSSDSARVKTVEDDGRFGDKVYEKPWTEGWADLEMLHWNDTTYILHQKRFPHLIIGGVEVDPFASVQGFTRISRVQRSSPFSGDVLGEKVHEETWGDGWNEIKFFSVGEKPFLFRYNSITGSAQTFEIDTADPFGNHSLGRLADDEIWRRDWDIIRFFKIGDDTYVFLLDTESGRVKIHQMDGSGRFGELKHQADWTGGWDNVSFMKHSDGNTYFITIKSSTGKIHYSRFKRNDPFSHTTPYEILTNTTWKKGWTHSAFYQAPEGFRLLLLKR